MEAGQRTTGSRISQRRCRRAETESPVSSRCEAGSRTTRGSDTSVASSTDGDRDHSDRSGRHEQAALILCAVASVHFSSSSNMGRSTPFDKGIHRCRRAHLQFGLTRTLPMGAHRQPACRLTTAEERIIAAKGRGSQNNQTEADSVISVRHAAPISAVDQPTWVRRNHYRSGGVLFRCIQPNHFRLPLRRSRPEKRGNSSGIRIWCADPGMAHALDPRGAAAGRGCRVPPRHLVTERPLPPIRPGDTSVVRGDDRAARGHVRRR